MGNICNGLGSQGAVKISFMRQSWCQSVFDYKFSSRVESTGFSQIVISGEARAYCQLEGRGFSCLLANRRRYIVKAEAPPV